VNGFTGVKGVRAVLAGWLTLYYGGWFLLALHIAGWTQQLETRGLVMLRVTLLVAARGFFEETDSDKAADIEILLGDVRYHFRNCDGFQTVQMESGAGCQFEVAAEGWDVGDVIDTWVLERGMTMLVERV
jgi:hypothetical protein